MRRPEDGLDRNIRQDLDALSHQTVQGLPDWPEAERQLRDALSGARRPAARAFPRRLAWLTSAAVAAAVVLLLFIPIDYTTVAGQQVALAVPWPLGDDARAEVVRGLRAVVNASDVRIEMTPAGTRLTAMVRGQSGQRAREDAEAFARHIQSKGAAACVSVQPAMTTNRGSLYGFAADRLGTLLVSVRGRTNDEIEQDVRRRLEAIGFREADVKVEHDGGRTDIKFRATDGEGRVEENEYRRELRGKGGAGPGAEPPFDLPMPDLSDLDNLPLDQRRDAIEKRLRDLGIDARVTIENGRLRIDAVHDVIKRPGKAPSNENRPNQ